MTFEGKKRTWVMYVPSGTPTGLVVSVHPVLDADVGGICAWIGMEEVMKQTGALVVCPAALSRAGVKGGGEGACWKAWGHYGSCEAPDEDSEDVDFLAAMIQQISQEYSIAPGKTIMSGMSNGGSMAFRFNCEQSDLIDGLVIQSQAYLDPWIGFYDYEHDRFPTGTPQCNPTKKVPFYSDIGTADVYYGSNVAEQFRGFPDWQTYSTVVLGCTGQPSTTSEGPVMPQGATTCYEYASCPSITSSGINRYCNVTGMEHDPSHMDVILNKAFSDFFDGHMVV
jgi:poly(3-hydroxybutyrate) depolymerase